MDNRISQTILAVFALCSVCGAETVSVESPDGRIEIAANDDCGTLKIGVSVDGEKLLPDFKVGLKTSLADIGENAKLSTESFLRTEQFAENPNGIRRIVPEVCNSKRVKVGKKVWLILRAYDDGVAYRFETALGDVENIVDDEILELPLDENDFAAMHFVNGEETSFESSYYHGAARVLKEKHSATLPFVFKKGGKTFALIESDVHGYPSLRLSWNVGDACPKAVFSKYPKTLKDIRKYKWKVVDTFAYIAKTTGLKTYPWRAFAVARDESELAVNDLSWRLASPARMADIWEEHRGKSLWDWWNNWVLDGVGFKSGINIETYKYHVDFAARHGIKWIVIDTGWLNGGEIGKVSNDGCDEMFMDENLFLDVPEIIRYAHSKKVKVMPWILARTLKKYGESAYKIFAKWGADGLKIDFLERDDQLDNTDMEEMARLAAKYCMSVDFHGCPPPVGLWRTYPNVLNFEAVKGAEATKWSSEITPAHLVDVALIRMLAGPLDFTPGCLENRSRENFNVVYTMPQMQGTRANMLAQFVVFHAPFQMLCDSPSKYAREPQTLSFITGVPASWDESKALSARLGKHIIVARRKGKIWYVGGMCDWDGMEYSLDLSRFLGKGVYNAEIYVDGVNANRTAKDFKKISREVSASDKIKISMKSGGGFAMKITLK